MTTDRTPVDLVVAIDSSRSMSSKAKKLSADAEKAITAAALSCPSDLRVVWLGLEGKFAETNFQRTVRDYLVTECSIKVEDLKALKKGDKNKRAPSEDGAGAINDISTYFDWRPGAMRAILYLSDEALDGSSRNKKPNEATLHEANLAIMAANSQLVVVHTYFAAYFDETDRDLSDLELEYGRVASETSGVAFTTKDSLEGFVSVLQEVICATQSADREELEERQRRQKLEEKEYLLELKERAKRLEIIEKEKLLELKEREKTIERIELERNLELEKREKELERLEREKQLEIERRQKLLELEERERELEQLELKKRIELEEKEKLIEFEERKREIERIELEKNLELEKRQKELERLEKEKRLELEKRQREIEELEIKTKIEEEERKKIIEIERHKKELEEIEINNRSKRSRFGCFARSFLWVIGIVAVIGGLAYFFIFSADFGWESNLLAGIIPTVSSNESGGGGGGEESGSGSGSGSSGEEGGSVISSGGDGSGGSSASGFAAIDDVPECRGIPAANEADGFSVGMRFINQSSSDIMLNYADNAEADLVEWFSLESDFEVDDGNNSPGLFYRFEYATGEFAEYTVGDAPIQCVILKDGGIEVVGTGGETGVIGGSGGSSGGGSTSGGGDEGGSGGGSASGGGPLSGSVRVQAEDGLLLGGAETENNQSGFEGSGFVGFLIAVGSGSTINVDAASNTYQLDIRYAAGENGPETNRIISMYVNGKFAGNLAFTRTGSWSNWATKSVFVELQAGSNEITFVVENEDTGYVNIDYIELNPFNGKIALTTEFNNQYVGLCQNCVDGALYDESAMVHVGSPSAGIFAEWEIEPLENGRIAFKSLSSGKYMGLCRNCNPSELYSDSVTVHIESPDEGLFAQWEVETLENGRVAIKSPFNGQYVGLCRDCIDGALHQDSLTVHVADPNEGSFAQWEMVVLE
ncbi:MAG: CBM35 domain-containing protein, partial [Chloroflexota bacterium]